MDSTDKMERYRIDMIDKMKNDSSTHLDPARAANGAMGGKPVKETLTSCVFRKFEGGLVK